MTQQTLRLAVYLTAMFFQVAGYNTLVNVCEINVGSDCH